MLTEEQAEKFISSIKKTCKESGVWCTVTQSSKPSLEFAEIKISLKVDKQ